MFSLTPWVLISHLLNTQHSCRCLYKILIWKLLILTWHQHFQMHVRKLKNRVFTLKLRQGLLVCLPMGLWKDVLNSKNHTAQPHFILQAFLSYVLFATLLRSSGYSTEAVAAILYSNRSAAFTVQHPLIPGRKWIPVFLALPSYVSFKNSVRSPAFYSCFSVKTVMLSHTFHLTVETTWDF